MTSLVSSEAAGRDRAAVLKTVKMTSEQLKKWAQERGAKAEARSYAPLPKALALVTVSSETASVTFGHIKNRGPTFWEVKVGKITWQASAEEVSIGCRYTGSGSRAANSLDAFLNLSPRLPFRAFFSSPDDLQIRVLRTCGNEAREDDATILHPFFLLFRKTAGVRVDNKLRSIVGSSNSSTTSSSGHEAWKYSWSFRAIR